MMGDSHPIWNLFLSLIQINLNLNQLRLEESVFNSGCTLPVLSGLVDTADTCPQQRTART
jgi:hypothetical protein